MIMMMIIIMIDTNAPRRKCDPTLAPRLGSNEKIFDVWNSHTKHCKHCLEAARFDMNQF